MARCPVDGGPSLAMLVLAGRAAEMLPPVPHSFTVGSQEEGGGEGGEDPSRHRCLRLTGRGTGQAEEEEEKKEDAVASCWTALFFLGMLVIFLRAPGTCSSLFGCRLWSVGFRILRLAWFSGYSYASEVVEQFLTFSYV